MRMAQVLSIKEYDAVTKDLARASYVVPRSYILWIYESGLFADRESPVPTGIPADRVLSVLPDNIRLALPPHVDPSPNDQINEKMVNDQMVNYRGIPYADIVQQLMLAMGAAGGAEIGERNTVYFSLANYMRYICDFNADLLLAILPDFGLSESERRQAISSAIGRPRKSQTPVIVQSAIAICEREMTNDKFEISNIKSTMLKLPPLPRLLKLICRRLPEEFQPAMVIAALPVLGI